jgi:hypothetical protein
MLDAKDPNFEVGNATDFGPCACTSAMPPTAGEFVGIDVSVLDTGGPVTCN